MSEILIEAFWVDPKTKEELFYKALLGSLIGQTGPYIYQEHWADETYTHGH